MKKCFSILLFFLFIISPITNYADDVDYENEDFSSLAVISNDITNIPNINARNAIVFDRSSKQKIFGKKETDKCKMASTTKIMTAIIVLENSSLDNEVTISSKSSSTGGSRLGLKKGDCITVHDLLYGLLLKSGNDAAVALAEHVGGSIENFANLMNKKAKDLNLVSTHFVTPHGLDNDNHYTSALDLAYLADYALSNDIFSEIVKTKYYTVKINGTSKFLTNTNELLGFYDGVYGVKTGFTNGANRCLVSSCKRGDLDLICVVLGCDTKKDRTRDSINLLNYSFNNYTLVNIFDLINTEFDKWSSEHKNSFIVYKGVSQNVELSLNYNDFNFFCMAIKNTEINNLTTSISFNSFIEAPLDINREIGKISLNMNDSTIINIRIISQNNIGKKNIYNYLTYIFKNYSNFFKNSLKTS